jgi:hypothetical protein
MAALALTLITAFSGVVPVVAQESAPRPAGIVDPWVVVIVPETAEDDARTGTLALVVADTIEMTLRLIGDYVVQPRPEGAAAPRAANVADYADRERMDYVVFGEVSAGTGSETSFHLSVYSREVDAVTLEREAVARSLFDTFAVADELSAEPLGAFTGQRIAYGRVELRNQAELPGAYRVYLDGSPAGTSVAALDRVLVGEREVAVEALEGPRAGTIVARERLTVTEGGAACVTFTAEGVRAPEPPAPAPDPIPPVAVVEQPVVATPPVAAPSPPPSDAGRAPEEPVIRIPDEPEIPLEWRVYPWGRWEREGEVVFTGSALVGMERRPGITENWAFLSRLQLRADWGDRSVAVLALEGNIWDFEDGSFLQPDPSRLEENPLNYDTLYGTDRASVAYGMRFTPLRRLSVTPLARLGFERADYIITSLDADGNENLGGGMTLGYTDDAQGASTWNVVPGLDVILETHIRRFALQALFGVHAILPTEDSLSNVYAYEYWDPGTNDWKIVEAPVSSDLGAAWGWYYGIGGGYSWGGSEERVNETLGRERPNRIFSPGERSPWRGGLQITVALPYRIGPGYEGQALQFPLLGTGIGGAVQLSHRSGFLLAPFAYAGPPWGRTSTALFQSTRDGSISSTTVATEPSPVLLGAGIGRRLALTDSLFLTAEYRIAHAATGKYVRINSHEFKTSDFAGSEGSALWLGPRLLLEHAIVGTGAVVYGGLWSFAPTPLGVTRYSQGLVDDDSGNLMTTDGLADTAPFVVMETGVVIRLFAAPNRFYADAGSERAWFRYSPNGSAAGVGGATEGSAPEPGVA